MSRIAPHFKNDLEPCGALRAAGIETYATLAPLLPCDPETGTGWNRSDRPRSHWRPSAPACREAARCYDA